MSKKEHFTEEYSEYLSEMELLIFSVDCLEWNSRL